MKHFIYLSLLFLMSGCSQRQPPSPALWDAPHRTFALANAAGEVLMTASEVSIRLSDGRTIRTTQPRYRLDVDEQATVTQLHFTDQQKELDISLHIAFLDERTCRLEAELSNQSEKPMYLDRINMISGTLTGQKPDTTQVLITSADWQNNTPVQFIAPGTPPAESMYTLAIREPSVAAGFLAGKQHFNHFTLQDTVGSLRLSAWGEGNGCELPPGTQRAMDPLFLAFHDNALQQLERFADLAAHENDVQLWPENRAVWCTWYAGWNREKMYSYKNGIAAGIQENIPAIKANFLDRGANTMRICDDHIAYGDWRDTTRAFPNGLSQSAEIIDEAGLIPGVWYPTYWASTESEVYAQHPEWFALEENGEPYLLKDEFQNRSRLAAPHKFLTFDTSVPAVQDYFEQTARRWRQQGFRYVTNDFLAFATLPPRYHDPTVSKAQVLRKGLEAVKRGLGNDVFYRTIGAQFGTAMGLSHDMRISGDSHGDQPFAYHRTGAVWYYNHRVWLNDPSAIVFMRYGETRDAEWNKMWISWIALAGTVMTYGEQLNELPDEYIEVYQRMFPPLNRPGRPLDLWENQPFMLWGMQPDEADDTFGLFGVFDLESDEATKVTLNLDEVMRRIRGWQPSEEAPAQYLLWDFWEKKLLTSDEHRLDVTVDPRSCRLFALRPNQGHPQLLGTSGHFSMGFIETDALAWDANQRSLAGQVQGNGGDPTQLYFYVPDGFALRKTTLDGGPVNSTLAHNVLTVQVPATDQMRPFRLEFSAGETHTAVTRPFTPGTIANKMTKK